MPSNMGITPGSELSPLTAIHTTSAGFGAHHRLEVGTEFVFEATSRLARANFRPESCVVAVIFAQRDWTQAEEARRFTFFTFLQPVAFALDN